ncbi:MAG: hypothetical protein J6Y53_05445 [Alphaproteobacteria bacterium]|nr:hypothetical protein [Alphaproteobacteria bacterium]
MVESDNKEINQVKDEPEQSVVSNGAFRVAPAEQDIAAMSKETGTAIFSYADIHNAKVDNELHYDYKKVIDGMAQVRGISPLEAEKVLLNCWALRPLPNGEYLVAVGRSTQGGGGMNLSGEVYFSFNNDNIAIKYHEMAHSYQRKDDLFDDETLDKIYIASEEGGSSKDEKAGKLPERNSYKRYLKEVHAEVFAQTALMLREESRAGFLKRAVLARSFNDSQYIAGMVKNAIYHDGGEIGKMYAGRQAMRAAVREVAAIRKAGKRGEYFNADGTLNGRKVSALCEKIVLDKAYSPRTYQAFLGENIIVGEVKGKNGWEKDALSAWGNLVPATVAAYIYKGKRPMKRVKEKIGHKILKLREIKALKKMTEQRKKCDNPQEQAVSDYEYIHAKILVIGSRSIYANSDRILREMLGYMYRKEADKDTIAQMELDAGSPRAFEELSEINGIICENKSNPYFCALMDNPANIIEARQGKLVVSEQAKTGQENTVELPKKGDEVHPKKVDDMSAEEKRGFLNTLRRGKNPLTESSKQGISSERKEMGSERAGQVSDEKIQLFHRTDGSRS